MKSILIALTVVTALAAGCVVVPEPSHREGAHHDRDRDGAPDRVDRDRDGDGVRNRDDRRSDDPRRD
jgi:hypothetical protein